MPHAVQRAPAEVGDAIVVDSHRAGAARRQGEILEVFGEPGRRQFRVRWDDGYESVFSPPNDAFVCTHTPARRQRGMTITTLSHELESRHVAFELIHHEHTERALDEARALGLEPDKVAKTIVLVSGDGYLRAVLPASKRLDLPRVRVHLGDHHVRLATETELVGAYPTFELGAVPPFGGPSGDRVLVDRRIAEQETTVLETETHDESISLATADLITLTGAEVADICLDH